MNSTFVQEIVNLPTLSQVKRALDERRTKMLQEIGDRTLEPTKAVMLELAEINIALGDVPYFPGQQP